MRNHLRGWLEVRGIEPRAALGVEPCAAPATPAFFSILLRRSACRRTLERLKLGHYRKFRRMAGRPQMDRRANKDATWDEGQALREVELFMGTGRNTLLELD
jgi:hypothetical protein